MKKVLFAIQVIIISLSLPAYIIAELSHEDGGSHRRSQHLQVQQGTGTAKTMLLLEALSVSVCF